MYRILTLILLLVSLGFAKPPIGLSGLSMKCGSNPSPYNILDASANVTAAEHAASALERRATSPRPCKAIKIDTYFHVLAENETLAGGWVPQSILNTQLNILKKGYEPAHVQFELKKIDYTLYHNWTYYNQELSYNGPDLATKKKLRKGDYKTLNIFIMHEFASHGLLGWATYPNKTEKRSDQFWLDGVHILATTLPGLVLEEPPPFYNSSAGTILVHEVGHWFGLLHTFGTQFFDCDGPGDYVDDTPQEAFPNLCTFAELFPDEPLDSCPDKPGANNLGNWMTYSEDWCMRCFTEGQVQRMWSWWKLYRGGNDGAYWYWPPTTPSPSPSPTPSA